MKKRMKKRFVEVVNRRNEELFTLNPLLELQDFGLQAAEGDAVTTLEGVMSRTIFLSLLSLLTAVAYWEFFSHSIVGNMVHNGAAWPFFLSPFLAWGVQAGISRHRPNAVLLAPFGAVVLGVFYGTISGLAELGGYGDLAMAALSSTFLTVFGMAFAYRQKWVRAGPKQMRATAALIHGIVAIAAFDGLLSFFDLYYGSQLLRFTPLAFTVGVALLLLGYFVLLMDISVIEDHLKARAPKELEWFLAYAILFDVVWIYFVSLILLVGARKKE